MEQKNRNENEAILSVKDLVVKFSLRGQELTALRGVSMELYKGESLAIVGESGSGKSVFCKSFIGMLDKNGWVESGEIWYNGTDIAKYKKDEDWIKIRGKEIAIVFQDPMTSLNPLQTVGTQIREALELHQGLKGVAAQEKAIEILSDVGILEPEKRVKDYPHQFSGGMRQRVVIAIAIACNPKILICDEPTTALDVTIQAQILELMKQLQKKLGMAIIMITHDLGVVADMADEIIVMYAGKIVEKGSNEEIFYNPRHPYTWALMNSVPRLDLDNKEQLVTIEGTIPDMIHPPKGCAFCSRCPYAMNICAEYSPETIELKGGHQVACWLTDPRADVSGVPFHTGGEQDEQ